ncbi:zinc finger BED domain-containing protein 5-like [Linepithema humile]|uniref:zinc finger BED domain-containing protein 5-like n=1 Tax=Linepithema humile TaxID=83485 RepID=UPI00351DAAE2
MVTTPVAAMGVMFSIEPFHQVVVAAAAMAAYRLRCELKWKKGARHTRLPEDVLLDPIFEMRQDRIPIIRASDRRFKVYIPRPEEWEKEGGNLRARVRGEDVWYTDGSKTDTGSGAGFFGSREGWKECISLDSYATTVRSRVEAGRHIRICTDSQAAIKTLGSDNNVAIGSRVQARVLMGDTPNRELAWSIRALTKAKRPRIRKFQSSWLDENVFKRWLAPHPTLHKALCTVCNKTIRCCKSNLLEHSQSDQHIEQINSKNVNINFSNNDDNSSVTLSHKDKVKRAEIKLAAFFAEHNIAFYSADYLIPLLKDICMIPEVVSDLSLARDKCTKVVTQVIAKREIEKIVTNLQKCKFSILIDESTDISDKKLMCVLVQYVSPFTKKVTTQLLNLLSVDATDCSANKLFEIFKNMLNENKISLQNIVGMASDNASVMIGCNNSFMSRLKLEIPGLVTLNCICHSSALVVSRACEKLPESCKNLIRGVSTYISGSAKRCAILGEFQAFFNVERNKILKLSNTRWLVLHKCVVRLLNNWEVLKNFFILAVVEDKLKSAEIILNQLNDNCIKAYLLFLKYSLNFFNEFNALFQARKVLIHTLFENSQQLIREIAQNFIIPEALKCIVNFNINDKKNIKNINNIYVGPECESLLETLSLECAQEIKLNCLEFYITAVRKMLKRLPYRDTVFEQLMFLQPKVALYDESRIQFKNLTFIATRIGDINIDITKLAFE